MQATGHEVIRCVHKVDINGNCMERCNLCELLIANS